MDYEILIACESSGTVRDAFVRHGFRAISCDLLPTDSPGPHYQGDVRDLLGEKWSLVIAHPTCTYLTNSGVRWLYNADGSCDEERWELMREGAAFFKLMSNFNSPRIAIENPVMHSWATHEHGLGKATQYVQPWQFGHMQSKRTGLWLFNLPPLMDTDNVYDEMMKLPYGKRNEVHHASPGPDRWKMRSKTYAGFAEAMAAQWGPLL